MNEAEFRMAVTEVLIEHTMAIDERRQNRAEKLVWPDESDIYTMTIMRLRTLFAKEAENK